VAPPLGLSGAEVHGLVVFPDDVFAFKTELPQDLLSSFRTPSGFIVIAYIKTEIRLAAMAAAPAFLFRISNFFARFGILHLFAMIKDDARFIKSG
jgi:hypothetical protein